METNHLPKKQNQSQLTETRSKTKFIDVLARKDNVEIAVYLSDFKERGVVNFKAALAVPSEERIPILSQSKEGFTMLLNAISGALTGAFENINLRIGLTETQIVDLAEKIIDESFQDNLSLEDVVLFLQELVTGRAGKIYDRMDIPTFFELFETYRQRRHEALEEIRYEQNANRKAFGPTDRASEDEQGERNAHREALGEHLKHIYKPKE